MIICMPYYNASGGAPPTPPVAIATFDITALTVGSTAGMTLLQNNSVDDSYMQVGIPFTINFLGVMYSRVFIGSNSYATFGEGSGNYTSIQATNPPLPGIHISAGDKSYQRIYSITESSDLGQAFRVRYEGSIGSSGTPGSPTLMWELKFYRDHPNIIDVVIGRVDMTTTANGVTKGTAPYLYVPSNQLSSYRITSTV